MSRRTWKPTRKFYEDLIGLPLLATWCEAERAVRRRAHLRHCFFGLADGSALAFFQFANDEDQKLFGPKMPESPFHHIAMLVDEETQQGIEERLRAGGYDPKIYVLEHGYAARSTSSDPDGMICEFTVDHPDVEKINATQRVKAHAELKRWLAGDHANNNMFRTEHHT